MPPPLTTVHDMLSAQPRLRGGSMARRDDKQSEPASGGEAVARRDARAPGRKTLTEALPAAARRASEAGVTPTMGEVATAPIEDKGAGAPPDGELRRKIEPHV